MPRPLQGFPAHAGMDPGESTPYQACRWFPRPRGDGPHLTTGSRIGSGVSPPTRGWTVLGAAPAAGGGGFPAHAGMDPPVAHSSPSAHGFPRPRGDGPSIYPADLTGPQVSPPTRGWTVLTEHRVSLRLGFPAHAGMDPPHTRSPRSLRGFPRPRGDGPRSPETVIRPAAVSPPTRGWTHGLTGHRQAPRGFPAHAGMDRRLSPHRHVLVRFPRPRGDGPPAMAPVTMPSGGFPAHAGMDPFRFRWPPSDAGFPRPRGDGPAVDTVLGTFLRGFPAHAGMDLTRIWPVPSSGGFPRPRGDGPRQLGLDEAAYRVSPPTRGWTFAANTDRRPPTGFPAHAGMDPRSRGAPDR